jgi:hypothetical protein
MRGTDETMGMCCLALQMILGPAAVAVVATAEFQVRSRTRLAKI